MTEEEITSQDSSIEFLSTHELDTSAGGPDWGCVECGELLCKWGEDDCRVCGYDRTCYCGNAVEE